MNTSDQRICLWFVPVFGTLLAIGFGLFPGFAPPMSPAMSAVDVGAFFQDHVARIRASMILFNLCSVALIPFFMVIVVQMKRMGSHAFAYSYLSAAASGATLFALADLAWLIAAFRPERNPELTQLLDDLAWIALITPVGFIMAQNACLAMAIYLDRSSRPVFPRWVAHFNVATALLMAPGAFALAFLEGPLAWDGVLAFWCRLGSFALYIVVMVVAAKAAVDRQAREQEEVRA